MEKVVLVGNCHIHNIAICLELMAELEEAEIICDEEAIDN